MRVKDEMCRSNGASNGWVRAAIRGMADALNNASKVETPTTLFQMEEDEWVLPGAQDRFVQSAQHVHKEYLSESPHEVFNTHDKQREAYIKRVLGIFDAIR